MVRAGALRLLVGHSLDHPTTSRIRVCSERGMVILDSRFCVSADLADCAAQSRLEADRLAAEPRSRGPLSERNLFSGRQILVQALCVRHLLHPNDGPLARLL